MTDRAGSPSLTSQAQDLIDRGDAARALALLQTALQPNADIFAARASAHLALGEAGNALQAARAASRLDPRNAAARFNEGRALMALGEPEAAAAAFAAAEAGYPGVAEIAARRGEALYLSGDDAAAEAAFGRALALSPAHPEAFQLLTELFHQHTNDSALERLLNGAVARGGAAAFRAATALARLGRRQEALAALERVEAANGPAAAIDMLAADLLREEGAIPQALSRARAAAAKAPGDVDLNAPLARLLLMTGGLAEAEALARRMLALAPSHQLWLAFLWTALAAQGSAAAMLDFEGDVGVLDLDAPQGYPDMEAFNAALAAELEPLHRMSGHPLAQSVHGGSQTRRPLQTMRTPTLAAFFAIAGHAVQRFIDALPEDRAHLFRRWRGTKLQIKAAWSVALARGGRHSAHVHPGGIVSSAYYVALPPRAGEAGQAGFLALGQPPFEAPGVDAARRVIAPRPGRLVLFPSYCWHGTIPFDTPGRRLTIAFDAGPA